MSNPNPTLVTAQAEVNDTMLVELDRVTCMTAGEDIFRTFDNARFTYYSTCTIALLKTGNGLEVYTQTLCDANNKCNCRKVGIDPDQYTIFFKSNFSSLYFEKKQQLAHQEKDGCTCMYVYLKWVGRGRGLVLGRREGCISFLLS